MNRRRPEPEYYCPRCGSRARYLGFYQCTGDGGRVEIGELITADRASRIRAETAAPEEMTCDALF